MRHFLLPSSTLIALTLSLTLPACEPAAEPEEDQDTSSSSSSTTKGSTKPESDKGTEAPDKDPSDSTGDSGSKDKSPTDDPDPEGSSTTSEKGDSPKDSEGDGSPKESEKDSTDTPKDSEGDDDTGSPKDSEGDDDTEQPDPEPAPEPLLFGLAVNANGDVHPNLQMAGWWRGSELVGMSQVFDGLFQSPPELSEPGTYVVHLIHGQASMTYPGTFAFATLKDKTPLDMGKILLPKVPRATQKTPGETTTLSAAGLSIDIDIAGIGNVSDETGVPSLMLHRVSLADMPLDKLGPHQNLAKPDQALAAWTPFPEAWKVEAGNYRFDLSQDFGLEDGDKVELLGFLPPWFTRQDDENDDTMFRVLSSGVVEDSSIKLETSEFEDDLSWLFLAKAP